MFPPVASISLHKRQSAETRASIPSKGQVCCKGKATVWFDDLHSTAQYRTNGTEQATAAERISIPMSRITDSASTKHMDRGANSGSQNHAARPASLRAVSGALEPRGRTSRAKRACRQDNGTDRRFPSSTASTHGSGASTRRDRMWSSRLGVGPSAATTAIS